MNKDELINSLIRSGALKTPVIIEAFTKIDRADFVLPRDKEDAYENHPLDIGYNATISQPYTVAFMLELLEVQPGEKVLDVGSGSGWTTALLTYLVGERGAVFGVEIIPELVVFGTANLAKYQFKNASIQAATKTFGLPLRSPFDKILVSAASETLPVALTGQLAVGGRMVLPIAHSVWQIDKVSSKRLDRTEYPGFAFVPLRG